MHTEIHFFLSFSLNFSQKITSRFGRTNGFKIVLDKYWTAQVYVANYTNNNKQYQKMNYSNKLALQQIQVVIMMMILIIILQNINMKKIRKILLKWWLFI